VKVLLKDWQGGLTETTDNGSTALHFAARNGFPEVVRVLVGCTIVKTEALDREKNTCVNGCHR
jgi:ankyrin repeat protein